LETEWTGANSPDVMFLEYIPTYASTGMLEDLTPFINAERNFRLDDFYPNLLDMFRYKGGLYGLPRDNDAKVIYVNLKLLKEAGVELPKGGWTWQDLREASRKLTKRDANGNTTQYGFAFELDDWWRLWVWQNGGDIFDTYTPPDPPSRLVLNSPDSIEAIQFLSDLINKDKVSPSYDEMNTSEKISKLFRENKVAMAFGNHSLIPEFGVAPDLAWDVIPLPQSKKRVNALGGAGYVVHKNSKHKPEAWLLIKFLSDLGQVLFMDSGLIFPARQSIREDNIFLRTVKYNWQIFVEETKNGRQNPLFRSSNKIIGEIDKELLPVWKGQKSPAEVLAGLDKKIEPMLLELRK
jgi:multiple sugar transport system substrate-binding protein